MFDQILDIVVIIGLVFVFNFLLKTLLKRSQQKFEKENKLWGLTFIQALYMPLSYFIWFVVILVFFSLFHFNILHAHLLEKEDMMTALSVGAILALSWFALNWNRYLVKGMIVRSQNNQLAMDRAKIDSIGKLMTIIILFFGIFLLLEATGRSLSALIAFGGVGGLAIAFASQEVISNFFGGVMIYINRPFSVGDWIHLPERNQEGIVEEIGWYMTRIRSFEKRPLYIPNSIFAKMVVVTPSRMTHRQFKEIVSLRQQDYDVLQPIIRDIKEMVMQYSEVDAQQRVIVCLHAFGTYSLDIRIDFYVKRVDTAGYAEVKQDLLFKIAEIVARHNAKLALPTNTVQTT